MKIIFLCGCLEPGRDGVGDYCRTLAYTMIRKGLKVALLSYNDFYVQEVEQMDPKDGGVTPSILRLPSTMRHDKKLTFGIQWINHFSPDIISIQYVPYSFNKRGLPFGLSNEFAKLTSGTSTHVMFHEIWQGESKESGVKDIILGYLQRKISISIVSSTKAKWVSTTNDYYRNSILKAGAENVFKIPVFSNMPLGKIKESSVFDLLPNEITEHRSDYIIASFFGGLLFHHQIFESLIKFANDVRKQTGKKLIITHIGRSKGVENQFKQVKLKTGIETFVLGEFSEQDVADYLIKVDLGLTNYPKVLFEKSGSVAALLYNECPVVFLKEGFENDNRKISEITELKDLDNVDSFYTQAGKYSVKYGVEAAYDLYTKMFNN